MRILLAALLVVTLSGCSAVGYFACHKYDSKQATTDCG